MDYCYEIEKFLSETECDDVLNKLLQENSLQIAKIHGNKKNEYDGEVSEVRKSSIAFVKNIEILDTRLKNILKEKIVLKGYTATKLGKYQFTEYKTGEYYGWHSDSDQDTYKDRFCSIVLQLNNGYSGGDLEIILPENQETIKVKRGKGNLVIFFSNMEHRVTTVESGTRYTLVNWVSVDSIKDFKKTLI